MIKAKFMATGAVLAIAAMALTGCSSDSGSDSSSNIGLSEEAAAALEVAYTGVGTELNLDSIKDVPKDVNLYVVSCGEQVPGCSVPAAAVKAAAEKLGWTATIADGKLNPEGFATAIRQGVAGGANVIIPIGIGCGVAQAAFQEAVDAGVKIIGGGGVDDCDPKLWASERLWLEDFNPIQQWEEFGKLQADYAFGKHNGEVNAIVLNFTGQVFGQWITDGFTKELEALGNKGKVLETVDVSDPETQDGSMLQKVNTAILNNPDANTLIVPIDGWLVGGLAQAIVQSGSAEQLLVVSRGGDAPVLDMIRAGGQGVNATIGFAVGWGAWGSVDTAARVLSGGTPAWIGESMQAVDADHNMPKSGGYEGAVDYQKVFSSAWGK